MSHLDDVTTQEAIFVLFVVVARPRFNGLMRNISPNGCVFMGSSRDGEDRESGGLIDWQWWGGGWEWYGRQEGRAGGGARKRTGAEGKERIEKRWKWLFVFEAIN